jgi:hypothetical protein
MPSTLNGDTMECAVPTSSQLPEASSETGRVAIFETWESVGNVVQIICYLCTCMG